MPKRIYAASYEPMESIEEKWVKEHGETFKNYTTAGQQLGISKKTVVEMVKAGYIQTTPTKRILVRSAAAWANSNRPARKGLVIAR